MKALIFLFSFLLPSLAFGATCSTITWTNPGDTSNITHYAILYGADQGSMTQECQQNTVPSTSIDCSCSPALAAATTGVVGVQSCNGTICASVGVGALPADPPPTMPAPVTGVAAAP